MARALWRGAISFGLVTIPVSLYPAKDTREAISFHLLHKDDLSRVHNKRVDDLDHEVPFEDLVRGYEFEKGRYVILGDSDFKAANVEATQSIDIMHFVDTLAIDVTFFDTPYYTEPTKVGRKAYALLRDTLRRTGKAGVARIVIRERQHLCAVIPDGPALLACTLRWPYQLREASEFDLPGEDFEASEQEHKMAGQLVEAMAADVPILAYAAGAVPETLGGAGVLFDPKDLEFAAELLGLLIYDDRLRDDVLVGQRRRLRDFGPARIEREIDGLVARFA